MYTEYRIPIYLHFLDRELRNSVQFQPTDEQMFSFVETALLLTLDRLYVGNSLLWENIDSFPNTIQAVLELEKHDGVRLLSNHATMDEFLESRRKLYSNDHDRYPLYFNDSLEKKPWGRRVMSIEGSTTDWLDTQLYIWLKGQTKVALTLPQLTDSDQFKRSQEMMLHSLLKREGRAITYHLFQQPGQNKASEFYIRRIISFLYTHRYLGIMGGTILTGIEGLSSFDEISSEQIKWSYSLNRYVLKALGLTADRRQTLEEQIAYLLINRAHPHYPALLVEMGGFLEGIWCLANEKSVAGLKVEIVRRHIEEAFSQEVELNSGTIAKSVDEAYLKISSINNRLRTREAAFGKGYGKVRESIETKRVLLVTATIIELRMLINVFKSHGIESDHMTNGNFTYLNFGRVGDVEVYAFKSDMGSSGSGGATLAIAEAERFIQPDYVIAAGIAFGLQKDKQNIGDILVSRQLKNYEPAKIKEEVKISRGDKITASTLLIDRFTYSQIEWDKCAVHSGLVLSGEKLVNSKEFVEQLLMVEPEAIGGEMEGAGLMAVCQNVKAHWILVKAICDWGYEKESDYQDKAAQNTMEYVYLTISKYL
jgi:nucleoside phosphorylase